MNIFQEQKVPQVTAEEAKEIMEREEVILIDVRTPAEFLRGKIKEAINIPVDEIACEVEKTVQDKESKVFVYCLSGSRSIHAVDTMLRLGYKNVFDIAHGLLAWRAKGYGLNAE